MKKKDGVLADFGGKKKDEDGGDVKKTADRKLLEEAGLRPEDLVLYNEGKPFNNRKKHAKDKPYSIFIAKSSKPPTNSEKVVDLKKIYEEYSEKKGLNGRLLITGLQAEIEEIQFKEGFKKKSTPFLNLSVTFVIQLTDTVLFRVEAQPISDAAGYNMIKFYNRDNNLLIAFAVNSDFTTDEDVATDIQNGNTSNDWKSVKELIEESSQNFLDSLGGGPSLSLSTLESEYTSSVDISTQIGTLINSRIETLDTRIETLENTTNTASSTYTASSGISLNGDNFELSEPVFKGVTISGDDLHFATTANSFGLSQTVTNVGVFNKYTREEVDDIVSPINTIVGTLESQITDKAETSSVDVIL
jgi:hypothetical protein